MVELLHGKELEEFRKKVDMAKALEPPHDNEWVKSFVNLPLEVKIGKAITRIIEWIVYHEGKVYVSYSGGKDSTVLLHLVRRVYPECEAVFCNTGIEYPEVAKHAIAQPNVTVIKTQISFKKVIEEYGYPLPTKEISHFVACARRGAPSAIKKLNGTYPGKDGKPSRYCCPQWKYLLDAPFKISDKCCDVMKKKPFKEFERNSGKKPFIGTTAAESYMRKTDWQRRGCNAFSGERPKSKPLSPFTEQDILRYIVMFGLEIPSVYGEIKQDSVGKYYTTGVSRTGCMPCMFGVHLEPKPNRFQIMYKTHPKHYNAFINKMGLGSAMDYIGVDYAPDTQLTLFEDE
mgnify:CR=1 FL=1|jgi:3'-phosphoadenosine 5'-phosphosulfate sulfotransferase (PAPS reductase)/FAD synthetase